MSPVELTSYERFVLWLVHDHIVEADTMAIKVDDGELVLSGPILDQLKAALASVVNATKPPDAESKG